MKKEEIKQALHKLIDTVSDDILLKNIYEAFSKNETNPDRVELTTEQKNRLNESLEQYYSGKTISHEAMKTEIQKWRTK